jgi:hypothetical protein
MPGSKQNSRSPSPNPSRNGTNRNSRPNRRAIATDICSIVISAILALIIVGFCLNHAFANLIRLFEDDGADLRLPSTTIRDSLQHVLTPLS